MKAPMTAAVLLCLCALAQTTVQASTHGPLADTYPDRQWLWEPVNSLVHPGHGIRAGEQDSRGRRYTLQPGANGLLRLPAGYWLRLSASPGETTGAGGVAAPMAAPSTWYSRGNGLFVPAKLQPAIRGGEWLLPPPVNGGVVVLLENNGRESSDLWLSRATPRKLAKQSARRETTVEPVNESAWYRQRHSGSHLQLTRLQAGDSYSVVLPGPGEWRLEARTLAEDHMKWQRYSDLPLLLNDRHWRDWRLHPSLDHDDTLLSGQCQLLASDAESLHFALPEGQHTVSFIAPRAMAVRTMSLHSENFAFSRNQVDPEARMQDQRLASQRAPAAQPGYDEVLFESFLNGELSPGDIPPTAAVVSGELQPLYAAARLIDRRYRFWRQLPVADVKSAGGNFELIDVGLSDPGRGTRRYLGKATPSSGSGRALLELDPGRTVVLHAPQERPHTSIKISLAVTAQPYDLTLKNHRGETTVWRWLPEYIQAGDLDLVRDADLALLETSNGGSRVLSASVELAVARQEFPLIFSHSSGKTVLFSPFYRDDALRILDQRGWERALSVLGRDKMLSLLSAEARPENGGLQTLERRLEQGVWDDWQPLRNWLRSYRKIWSRGVASEPLADDHLSDEQLSTLTERLDGQGVYLRREVLRAVAVRDTDPRRRQAAFEWLHLHYSSAGDVANLSAWHSWRFQHTPVQRLEVLADWLVTVGLEAMAVRLYRLASSVPGHLPYQQARLDSGWLPGAGEEGALPAVWDAIWRQDWDAALRLGSRLHDADPWREFLAEMPGDGDPVSWLQWAYRAPLLEADGIPAAVPTDLDVGGRARMLQFYSDDRRTRLEKALAEPGSPVSYKLVGPIDVQLSLSLQHSEPDEILSDWIEISANGQQKWFPVLDSKVSPGIRALPQPGGKYVGRQKQVMLSLGPGRFEVKIRPTRQNVLVSARHLSPLLFSGLVNGIQQSLVSTPVNSYSPGELLKELDVRLLDDCRDGESGMPAVAVGVQNVAGGAGNALVEGSTWQSPHTLAAEDLALAESATGELEAETFLLRLLWLWPQTGDHERRRLIARANATAKPFLSQERVRAYLDKLNEDYSWQLEETIIGSAGSRRVEMAVASEHPVMAEREMLLRGGSATAAERLHGHHQIGLFTRFREPTSLVFDLRQKSLPYRVAPPATIELSINDEPLRTVSLPPIQQQLNVTIPAGPQNLRLRLDQPTSDHWVYVQAHAQFDGETRSLLEKKQRRYQVATTQQPLEIFLPEPRWLRIAESRNNVVSQRYHYQPEAGYLRLGPEPGESRTLYRVFGWQPKNREPDLGPYNFEAAIASAVDAEPGRSLPAEFRWDTLASPGLPIDQFETASAPATDGLYFHMQSRRDFDADVSSDKNEQFLETGWRHRRSLECPGCYWRSDVFARKHVDDNIKLVGTEQWLQGAWPQSSWRWTLQQSLFLQTSPDLDWSWLGSAGLTEKHDINEKMAHEYSLRAFGRYVSADNPRNPVDSDIYTRYKDQHRYGVRAETALRGRPWLDSLWVAEAGLTSNEDFNLLQPDYIQAAVGWRQYWRPLAFSAVYQHRLYLADDDRQGSTHRPNLRLAVNSMLGFQAGQILQWALQFDYDLDRDAYGFAVSLSWDYSRGRGLRDFRPSQTSFHSLRSQELNTNLYRRRMLVATNNGR